MSILLLIVSFERGILKKLSFSSFSHGMWFALLCDQVHNFVQCYEDQFVDEYKTKDRQSRPIIESDSLRLEFSERFFQSPCSFGKCSFSFDGTRLELFNLAMQIMH